MRKLQKSTQQLLRENRLLKQQLADRTNQPASDDDDDPGPRAPKRKQRQPSFDDTQGIRMPPRKRKRNARAPASTPRSPSPANFEPSESGSPAPPGHRTPAASEIHDWGREFVFKFGPWLIHDSVLGLELNPDIGDTPATRFVRDRRGGRFHEENLKQGQLRDVLEVIPVDSQWLRGDKDFKAHVRSIASRILVLTVPVYLWDAICAYCNRETPASRWQGEDLRRPRKRHEQRRALRCFHRAH